MKNLIENEVDFYLRICVDGGVSVARRVKGQTVAIHRRCIATNVYFGAIYRPIEYNISN